MKPDPAEAWPSHPEGHVAAGGRLPVVMLGVMAALPLLAAVGARAVPAADAQALSVIFPPGMAAAEAVARIVEAGGLPLAGTGLPGVWLVRSPAEGLPGRLYGMGAWLVLDAGGTAGCGPTLASR